jgi:hypothetical protein
MVTYSLVLVDDVVAVFLMTKVALEKLRTPIFLALLLMETLSQLDEFGLNGVEIWQSCLKSTRNT